MGNTRSRTNTPAKRHLRRPPASPHIRARRNLGPQFDNVYVPPPSPISYVEDSDNEGWDLGLDRPPPSPPRIRARRTLRAALDEAWENNRAERARRRLEELEELTRMMRMLNLGRKRKRSW